jgi:DNA-binding IclR family transcriptional regulator
MNKVNQETYARAIKLILNRPVSAHEIARDTGLHIVTAQRLMRTFKEHEIIYICNWRQDSQGRDAIPVYELGFRKDKPRRAMTQAQRQQRCRANKEKK